MLERLGMILKIGFWASVYSVVLLAVGSYLLPGHFGELGRARMVGMVFVMSFPYTLATATLMVAAQTFVHGQRAITFLTVVMLCLSAGVGYGLPKSFGEPVYFFLIAAVVAAETELRRHARELK